MSAYVECRGSGVHVTPLWLSIDQPFTICRYCGGTVTTSTEGFVSPHDLPAPPVADERTEP